MTPLLFLFFYGHWSFWVPPIVGAMIALWAQGKFRSTYQRYLKVPTQNGMTGADVARLILQSRGLQDVQVEEAKGLLTDHYDPRDRTLRLSEANFRGKSIAAVGVSAHEAGHAIQHADGYVWLQLRSSMVPLVSIGSRLAGILIPIGILLTFLMRSSIGVPLLTVAAYGLAAVVVFSLITLPVEIDASVRASRILGNTGILVGEERDGANKVLRAAAYTYVASAAVAILELVRVLMMLAMARGRN